jgi:hypothetical protein
LVPAGRIRIFFLSSSVKPPPFRGADIHVLAEARQHQILGRSVCAYLPGLSEIEQITPTEAQKILLTPDTRAVREFVTAIATQAKAAARTDRRRRRPSHALVGIEGRTVPTSCAAASAASSLASRRSSSWERPVKLAMRLSVVRRCRAWAAW